MAANSETILSLQSHPGDSSAQTVTGDKYKGDGYYSRADGLHTIQYNLSGDGKSNTFRGRIVIQASLATTPDTGDWFDVSATDQTYTGSSGSFIYNFTGNYVWVRAYVENWTDGNIASIKLNH
jgi:hypothetical protein